VGHLARYLQSQGQKTARSPLRAGHLTQRRGQRSCEVCLSYPPGRGCSRPAATP
jgi:hypothetical protein